VNTYLLATLYAHCTARYVAQNRMLQRYIKTLFRTYR